MCMYLTLINTSIRSSTKNFFSCSSLFMNASVKAKGKYFDQKLQLEWLIEAIFLRLNDKWIFRKSLGSDFWRDFFLFYDIPSKYFEEILNFWKFLCSRVTIRKPTCFFLCLSFQLSPDTATHRNAYGDMYKAAVHTSLRF